MATARHVALGLVLLMAPAAACAQAVLVVRSNDPSAGVIVDSTWVGRAAKGPFTVAPGSRTVRVVPGRPGTWGVPPVVRLVEFVAGDTVTVHGHFTTPESPDLEGRERHAAVFALEPPASRRRWIDYAAVGTALVAGAFAVHYKIKADRRFDVYRETGDPTLRPAIRRYDSRSAVAVGAMQAGLTVFAIRLVRK